MPNILTKRSLTPLGWAGIALLGSGLVLALLGIANLGFASYFPLVGLWCSVALFVCACGVLRTAGVTLDFFHRAVLVAFWAAAVLYAFWALNRRTFLYAWDYVNYILKQYQVEAAFSASPQEGFAAVFGSFSEDYTNFISLFTEFPFCLTARTGDSYAFAQVFCIVPALLVVLAGTVVKVGQMLKVRHRFYFFLIGLSWAFTYPFLRMSAMLAQPDWLGLVFAFAILLLTLDYRFDRLEPARFVLIFFSTAAIILTRRRDLYFVVGYYAAYALLVFCSSVRLAKQGEKTAAFRRVRNILVFGAVCLIAMVLLLWPMVSKILSFDYAGRYAYYNVGGMAEEIRYHLMRVGLLNFLLIALGLGFCRKKKLPALPCLAGCEILISMVLFTRVQNTGSHQMLLFVPGWILLFLVGAAALAEGIERRKALKLGYWGFTIAFAVSVRCSPLTVLALPDFVLDHLSLPSTEYFTKMDKLVYDRKDAGQIQALTDWLDEALAPGETAYMIPNDMLYNPDHFKYCDLPDLRLTGKLSDPFSIPGTHTFPMQFFEAKFVLTADPFPQTYVFEGELSHVFNEKFLAVRDQYFEPVTQFDMGNGTTFTIWRRSVAPTREEIEYYLAAFAAQDAQYPELFSQAAESWMAAHGL